jgi:hypothetical protein
MAVGTNDVAFRRLREDLSPALERGPAGAKVERLLSRISMIEVHLVACESTAAIGARNFAERPQEGCRAVLPRPNSRDFALSIRSVVADIRRSLVSLRAHGPF